MARVEFAPFVFDDLDRFFDHLAGFDVEDAATRLEAIAQAVNILGHSSLIGRPVKGGMRELIIGRGARG